MWQMHNRSLHPLPQKKRTATDSVVMSDSDVTIGRRCRKREVCHTTSLGMLTCLSAPNRGTPPVTIEEDARQGAVLSYGFP